MFTITRWEYIKTVSVAMGLKKCFETFIDKGEQTIVAACKESRKWIIKLIWDE